IYWISAIWTTGCGPKRKMQVLRSQPPIHAIDTTEFFLPIHFRLPAVNHEWERLLLATIVQRWLLVRCQHLIAHIPTSNPTRQATAEKLTWRLKSNSSRTNGSSSA